MSVCEPRGAFPGEESSPIHAVEGAFALAAKRPRRGPGYRVSKTSSAIRGQWSE